MPDEDIKKEEQAPKMSLREFIDDYQKTIAVIGVFTALGLFWKSFAPDGTLPYLSYLCFFITIPLLLEVRSGYKHQAAHWRLRWFMDIFTGIFLLTALHLLIDYPDHVGKILAAIIIFVLYTLLTHFLGKMEADYRKADYSRLTKEFEDIAKLEIPDTEKNVMRTDANTFYRKQRTRREFQDLLALIAAILLTVGLAVLLQSFLQAFIDYQFRDLQPMEIKPIQ